MIVIKNKLDSKELDRILEIEFNLFYPNSYEINEIKNMNEDNNFLFLLIYEQSIVIGYAILFISFDECEIYKIGIDKYYQRLGYGTKIINKLKDKHQKILIEVSDRDATKDFYLKNNFLIITIRKKYYYDGSNAIVMGWKKLKETL